MIGLKRLGATGAVVACLLVAGCGGDVETTTSSGVATTAPASTTSTLAGSTTEDAGPTLIEVGYSGGTVTGGGRREAPVGEVVSIEVTSDVADEVHLHGYDKKVDVTPGAPATLTFTADIPGIFEVELESRGVKLIDLVVK